MDRFGPQGDAPRPASSPDAQDQGWRAVGPGGRPGRIKQHLPAARAASPPRLLLDACASGPPILQDGPPATFEWLVFPRSSEMVLVMVNRSPEAEVRAGAITLTEIEDAELPDPGTATGAARPGTVSDRAQTPWIASAVSPARMTPLRTAQNLVKYLGYCGATAVVVPEDLTDRGSPPKSRSGRPTKIRPARPARGDAADPRSAGYCALARARLRRARVACRGCRRQIRPKRCGGDWSASTARAGPMGRPIIRCTRTFAKR